MPSVRVLYGIKDDYCVHDAAIREIESIFGIQWHDKTWDGNISVPSLKEDLGLKKELENVIGNGKVSVDPRERFLHSFGLSSLEIASLKNGKFPDIVDAVVEPEPNDLVPLINHLKSNNIFSIIYGGGSSVNGSLLFKRKGTTIAISTVRLKKYQLTDGLVTLGSGWKGIELEKKLNESGITVGQFPESIWGSTIGGWVATKAAGQESNYYGSIENRVVSATIVRSDGVLRDTLSPRESSGLMAKDIALGSEGRYGLISEVTVKVDPVPRKRFYRAFIVSDFENGINYIGNLVQIPAVVRLSDAAETEFALKNSEESFGIKYVRNRIKSKGLSGPSLLIMIDNDQNRIVKPPNSIALGKSPAETWERDRYERPYLGNELWKRGIVPDTLETSALWDNMAALHRTTISAFEKTKKERGIKGFIMSHISHVYRQGACIYFTLAIRSDHEIEDLEAVRGAVLENFLKHGSPVTHHHSPGTLMRKYEDEAKLRMQSMLRDTVFAGGDMY